MEYFAEPEDQCQKRRDRLLCPLGMEELTLWETVQEDGDLVVVFDRPHEDQRFQLSCQVCDEVERVGKDEGT